MELKKPGGARILSHVKESLRRMDGGSPNSNMKNVVNSNFRKYKILHKYLFFKFSKTQKI